MPTVATAPACANIPRLAGFTVAVTADRRAEEQANLLRRHGAATLLAPALRIVPLADDRLRAATAAIIAQPPDILIATTGIGIRAWLEAAEASGLGNDLVSALGSAEIVARGPKAAAAVRQAGLAVAYQEPTERLSDLLTRLATCSLRGQRVAVQLHGRGGQWVLDRLRAADNDVIAIPVYECAPPLDRAAARRVLDHVISGELDAITFTSPPAVDLFFGLATEFGLGRELRVALAERVAMVCVGPVTAEAARAHGAAVVVAPDRGRLGLLVHCVVDAFDARHRHIVSGGVEAVVQGRLVANARTSVELTGRQAALLQVLAGRAGAVVARSALLRAGWTSDGVKPRVVDVTIGRLRRRVAPIGLTIVAVPRRGYRLDATAVSCERNAVPEVPC